MISRDGWFPVKSVQDNWIKHQTFPLNLLSCRALDSSIPACYTDLNQRAHLSSKHSHDNSLSVSSCKVDPLLFLKIKMVFQYFIFLSLVRMGRMINWESLLIGTRCCQSNNNIFKCRTRETLSGLGLFVPLGGLSPSVTSVYLFGF